jgi:16S rRNA processing protein RimM
VLLARADVALHENEYFDADLLGCRVIDAAGRDHGAVVDVAHYPSQDMLFVGSRRAMLPLVGAFVRAIDLAGRRIEVDVPPGLLDGEPEEA